MIHSFKGYTPFIVFTVTVKYWLYFLCCTIYPCSLFIFVCSSSYLFFFFFVSFNLQKYFSLRYLHLFLLQTPSDRLWCVSWVGRLGILRRHAPLALLGGACFPAPALWNARSQASWAAKPTQPMQSLFPAPELEAELAGCLVLLL